jgi:hypothetical protein
MYGNQEAMDGFVSVVSGALSPVGFFSEENLGRIFAEPRQPVCQPPLVEQATSSGLFPSSNRYPERKFTGPSREGSSAPTPGPHRVRSEARPEVSDFTT